MGEGVRARLFAQVLADGQIWSLAVGFDVSRDPVPWHSLLGHRGVLQSPEHVALGYPIVNAS